MEYTSLGWLGKQQNALPINNRATFVGAANNGVSKTLCNLALSFWLWKSDELPTKKIRECCAKETQLSLISKIVASCLYNIVNTTLQLNICKSVLHEKLIKMKGEYVRGISDLSPCIQLNLSTIATLGTEESGRCRQAIQTALSDRLF